MLTGTLTAQNVNSLERAEKKYVEFSLAYQHLMQLEWTTMRLRFQIGTAGILDHLMHL